MNEPLSSSKAFENLNGNSAGTWYSAPRDSGPSDNHAGARIKNNPFFVPQIRPDFRITHHDKIFAFGSCFARSMEWVLIQRGFEVPSYTTIFDQYAQNRFSRKHAQRNFPSKLNAMAMAQQLSWSLVPDAPYPQDALIELPHGIWADPHSHISIAFSDRTSTLQRRRLLDELVSRVRNCRIIILAIDLNECWRDKSNGLIMNITPTAPMLQAYPDRFEFIVPTYEEVLQTLEQTHQVLKTHMPIEHEIVAVVSPVTLSATFTNQDVVLANWHSKSLLVAAAAQWASRYTNVHYFPAMEITYHSNPEKAWEEDRRHPSGSIINHMVDVFARFYTNSVNNV